MVSPTAEDTHPHTMVTGQIKDQVSADRKLPSCWLALTVLEDAMQGGGGETRQQSYPGVNPVSCSNDHSGKK